MLTIQESKLEKYLAVSIACMICTLRIATAASEIACGLAVLLAILLWRNGKDNLSLSKDTRGYMKAYGVFLICMVPSLIFSDNPAVSTKAYLGMWIWRYMPFILVILILDEVLSVGDGAFRQKSSKKMKEILKSGVTGILVSHSVPQIRELCNKILWLDHGKQIIFSDNVSLCCDAYEEFLVCKTVPDNKEKVEKLAVSWKERKEKQKQKAKLTEVDKIEEFLIKGNETAAVQAAVKFLQTKKPEVLK